MNGLLSLLKITLPQLSQLILSKPPRHSTILQLDCGTCFSYHTSFHLQNSTSFFFSQPIRSHVWSPLLESKLLKLPTQFRISLPSISLFQRGQFTEAKNTASSLQVWEANIYSVSSILPRFGWKSEGAGCNPRTRRFENLQTDLGRNITD